MLPTNRPPTHPGEMLLKEFLEPLGVSQVEAAKRMNIPFQRLNAIIKGRRAVSADTALLLEALTRWDAQMWLTAAGQVGPLVCAPRPWSATKSQGTPKADSRGRELGRLVETLTGEPPKSCSRSYAFGR